MRKETLRSVIERLAYRDTWEAGTDSYLDMLFPRLQLMKRLLTERGSIFVHIGPNISHYVKVLLDEAFGENHFVTEIIWQRTTAHFTAQRFAFVHDTIFQYSKVDAFHFTKPHVEHDAAYLQDKYKYEDNIGKYRLSDASGDGQGPPRVFFTKTISPPAGRHWPSQKYIDEHAAESRLRPIRIRRLVALDRAQIDPAPSGGK